MGKGGGGTPDPPEQRQPTAAETALTEESTALTRAGRRELESGGPLRALLQRFGLTAAASGSPSPVQLPGLQRGLQNVKATASRTLDQTRTSLANSRLLNTPFGQAILAMLNRQGGLDEAGLVDASRTDAISQGLAAAGAATQTGQAATSGGLGGLSNVVQANVQREAADKQFRASVFGTQATAGAGSAQATGSAIGSLAGLAATAAILFAPSNPAVKENITPVKPTRLLRDVRKINVQAWNYKWDPATLRHIGGMTTDMPDSVTVGNNAGVDVVSYLGMLTGAIQAIDRKQRRTPRRKAATRG